MMLVACLGMNAQEAKYQGEIDLSYSIGTGTFSTNRVNLHTIHGAKMNDYFSIGVGLGLDYYHELYREEGDGELVIPIFLNTKAYLPVDEKLSPYVSLDLGYGIGATKGVSGLGGFLWSPAIGLKYDKVKFQVGYVNQNVSESGISISLNAVQFMIGVIF